ncbi:MAG: AraC family transcriptional regulator [Clostridia bacterium]|nr:AraC family transcriptional regulator [Clostridia bacterium]
MDWIRGMQRAIDYVEEHLTEPIDYEQLSAYAYSSSYHFQRVFSILCGFTVGEYIRNRRLSLAGAELAKGNTKVIDVALKYGYESPDSFAKAFYKFHGVLPSEAKNNGNRLKSFSRLALKFSLEGGTVMNYRIEEKDEMVLTGYKRRFAGAPSERYEQQHDFMVNGETRFVRYALQGMSGDCSLEYSAVFNIDDDGYEYLIGSVIPNYFSSHLEKTIGKINAEKLHVLSISKQTYLVVESERSAKCMQEHLDLRKQVVCDLLTDHKYHMVDKPEITVYHYDSNNTNDSYIELWLPIENNK